MNRLGLALVCGMGVSGGLGVGGCSSSDDTGGATTPTPDSGATLASVAIEIACNDSIAAIYGDPGALPAEKGAILRCAKDADISMADLYATAQANKSEDLEPAVNVGYDGKPFTSGAHVYRVLFRTERGDTANTAGYSSAKVFLPDVPRAAKLPIVVAARGSRGQAASCTASKEDPSDELVNADYRALVYPLVGLGYAVIVPDLAGYANFGAANNPMSAYGLVGDVGKGTLDGARALKKLIPSFITDQTVIVGHSQGGDSALGALAIAETYGAPDIHLAAVATYAPLWFSQRSWAAIIQGSSQYSIHDQAAANAVSIWYHYTHGELLDGPGHGLDVFDEGKRAAIKTFVDTSCWAPTYPGLEAVATTPLDYFAPDFVSAIKYPSALPQACKAGDDLCAKWMGRYAADRPHLTGAAAKTPILITYGTQDFTIPSDRMACVFDRLDTDQATYKVCLTEGVGHSGNVRKTSSYVADWIAARTLGGADPKGCDIDQSGLVNDQGTKIGCATIPPND